MNPLRDLFLPTLGARWSIRPPAPLWVACGLLTLAGLACAPQTTDASSLPASRVESGFDFARHAFSFPNFGGVTPRDDFDADAMRRMFGVDAVCDSEGPADRCVLLPIAREYRDAINHALQGGRCEGFAVLAGLAARGELDLLPFGASEARDLSLEDNAPLQQELSYWFATQYLRDVVPKTTEPLDALSALRRLHTVFLDPDAPLFRVGMARLDPETGAFSGGHAVLATSVGPAEEPGRYQIGIYDNNHPDAERFIAIDEAANAWSYEAATNPQVRSVLYTGDPENRNLLYLAPVEPRLGRHPCTFCSGDEDADEESLAHLFTSAAAEVRVMHPDGHVLGEQAGALRAHPEAGHITPTFTSACVDCRDGHHAAFPHTDAGAVLELRRARHAPDDGADVDHHTAVDAHYFGPGFAIQVEGVDTEAEEAHTLRIEGHGAGARYESPQAEPGDETVLSVGVELNILDPVGADRVQGDQVRASVRVPRCTSAELAVDPLTGRPTLRARGQAAAAEGRIHVVTTVGPTLRSMTAQTPLPQNGSVQVDLAASNPGEVVTLLIDDDDDGNIDRVLEQPELGGEA